MLAKKSSSTKLQFFNICHEKEKENLGKNKDCNAVMKITFQIIVLSHSKY